MPYRACAVCGDLVPAREFRAHGKAHFDEQRPSARERGYDRPWERRRAEHLELEPWCRFHLERGQRVRATDVDHIVPRPAGSDDHSNLRSLCKSCHSRRTAIDQSGWGGATKGA
jgi:5-methylcytosine-specific restriction protein A